MKLATKVNFIIQMLYSGMIADFLLFKENETAELLEYVDEEDTFYIKKYSPKMTSHGQAYVVSLKSTSIEQAKLRIKNALLDESLDSSRLTEETFSLLTTAAHAARKDPKFWET